MNINEVTKNIEVLTHSSIRIHSMYGTIYVDPFQVKEAFNDAAFIFITHNHYDHYSPEDIRKVIGKDTVFIVPEKMKKAVTADFGKWEVTAVLPGETYAVKDIPFETVAAYNNIKPFHPKKNGWCGYVLTVDGNRVYIAGDTDTTKEAKAVKCDIALVPIGDTFTMDAQKASELINHIKPKVAIPIHYGTVAGKPEDGEVFRRLVDPEINIDIKLVF